MGCMTDGSRQAVKQGKGEGYMDSEKCSVLLCVLEEGSLSAAAEKLDYTPSGISRMIASMEKEAGLTLLVRGKEGVRATRECEQLLPAIREMSYWGRYYEEQTRAIRGIETGTVSAGSVYSVYYPWLSQMIAGFSSLHPGIQVDILEGTSSEMAEAIKERRGDFCIMSRREGDFRFIPLIRDEIVAILPKDHPFITAHPGEPFPLRQFDKEPYIKLYPQKESDGSMLMERNGIIPQTRLTTEDLFAGYAMVEAGLGISMENQITARQYADRIALLPLWPKQEIEIGIAIPDKKVISPAAEAFAKYALRQKPVV